jgi:hypothetical protein
MSMSHVHLQATTRGMDFHDCKQVPETDGLKYVLDCVVSDCGQTDKCIPLILPVSFWRRRCRSLVIPEGFWPR